VDLFEKRPDPRDREKQEGRSINLAISVRGIQALREIGLADQVLQDAIPMRGRMIHSRTRKLTFQPYGKDDSESINSISRGGLNVTLLQAAAQYSSVRLFFQQRCTGIDLHAPAIELQDETNHQTRKVSCNIVIGADGAYSAVRAQMQKQEQFNFQQDYLSHGYKELTMPALTDGSFAMEKYALHIWPRRSFMLIALPNLDGSFTCTLFLPFSGPNSFAVLKTPTDVGKFFQKQFPDAASRMPGLAADFFDNRTGTMVTVRCSPWHVGGRVLLIGDACHAVVPFLGQGMNAAFEDCTVLNHCLAEFGSEWEKAFQAFEARRKVHVDTLADLCLLNFLEMRDLVGSRIFVLKKKLDNLLHKILPRWYLPLYTMITFTRIPYADARQRAKTQQRVIRAILALLGLLLLSLLILWLRT